jgi:hypothetical protein
MTWVVKTDSQALGVDGLIKISQVFKGRIVALAFSKRYRSKRRLVRWSGLYRVNNPPRRKQEIFI